MGKQRDEDEEEEEKAGRAVRVGEGAEEEEAEDEEDEEEAAVANDDCFFESLDRVPSGVSFDLDIPSSGSDDEDDVRFSFASAVGPPSFRRISLSDDDDDDDEEYRGGGGGGGGKEEGGYDYGVWMAEPISIQERRRRLLQGMGLTSSKDLPVGSKSRRLTIKRSSFRSRRFAATDAASGGSATTTLIAAAATTAEEPTPSPQLSPSPLISRSRSDTQVASTKERSSSTCPILFRASSAPSSLCDRLGPRGRRYGDGDGDGCGAEELAPSLCKIKNLDNGKEFVVSEYGKDGTWGRLNDLQTGIQLTMEEFERFLGFSPIVKELMRRANLRGGDKKNKSSSTSIDAAATTNHHPAFSSKAASSKSSSSSSSSSSRKKGSWLKNIKFVASSMTGLISEKERDFGSSASIGGKSSSGSERMKVRQHGKSHKELTGLYMCQEIQAHQGSIWTIKFSSDSLYLASAGEDRVVHVWQVLECDNLSSSFRRQDLPQSPPPPLPPLPNGSSSDRTTLAGTQPSKKTRKGKASSASRRSSIPDHIVMPETIFSLSEKPVCSFEGHLDDVLDLSWSKSQYLLSSSMDKTVRLWDMETKACLKLFAHNDYVTCIQFNPIDDSYFISGSLDAKVRIWSVPDRQVVDWSDLHEMVTAACYTPDGQGALVGSHKGSCRFYNTSDSKLHQEGQVDIRNKKRKSHAKKITGFQFAPDNPSEVLITSADSQIRVFDGVDMIHKFRGFRNTSSQISASCTSDGKYVVCASEDSHVYIWKRDAARNASSGGKGKGWVTTRSHEHFYCKDVSVAIPWPSGGGNCEPSPSLPSWSRRHIDRTISTLEDAFPSSRSHRFPPLPKKSFSEHTLPCPEELCIPSRSGSGIGSSSFISASSSLRSSHGAGSSISASATSSSSLSSWGWHGGAGNSNRSTSSLEAASAWGLVVVTADLAGNIRVYQNFGLPLRLSRQPNLF